MTFDSPLTGQQLLDKIAEMKTASRGEIAIACGYIKTHKNRKHSPNIGAYAEAVIAAHNLDIGVVELRRKPGKRRSYSTAVNKFGTVAIRIAYTNEAGWKPGDTIGITVCDGEINLCRTAVAELSGEKVGEIVEGELCPF